MRYSGLLFWFFCSVLIWSGTTAYGANAVFSQDGNQIFFAAGNLKKLDLTQPTHLNTITSTPLLGGEDIQAVARAQDGSILCLSERHVAAFHLVDQTFTRMSDCTEKQARLKDLAVNPKDGLLLVSMEVKARDDAAEELRLMCFEPGNPQPLDVFDRRVPEMDGPIFDQDGNLFFSCRGDLWEGNIEIEVQDRETTGAVKKRGILNGVRIAPLARQETYEGTPEGTGVLEIAPLSANLYVQTHRWHGWGWGSILKMAKPVQNNAEPVDGRYQDFISILSTVQVLDTDMSSDSHLCASPDGRKVFYRKKDICWLIENDNKPKQLPLKYF